MKDNKYMIDCAKHIENKLKWAKAANEKRNEIRKLKLQIEALRRERDDYREVLIKFMGWFKEYGEIGDIETVLAKYPREKT